MSRLPAAGSPDDTIFALAAGGGGAAISVMRVSGAGSAAALAQLAGDLPPPRLASLRNLRAGDGSLLDRGLVLWFPAPRSYTGEDVCELHLHGGRAVARAVAEALGAAGCRPAEPGEFTRRAFLAGRMDLLEAEAIGDLVAAETESQRVRATAALAGGARSIVQDWSDRLLRCLAHQEALIDFPDETADAGEAAVIHQAQSLSAEIDAHLARAVFAERVRQGVRIAIVGAPNVGKSSLLNALARREAAIVSAAPGTTRDVVEVHLDLQGVAVTLSDTAGLRDTDDPVEREGIRRTHLAAAAADVVLHMMQSGTADLPAYPAASCLVVHSKADLAPDQDDALAVSAHSGFGLERLRERLTQMARELTADSGGAVLSHARQTAALRDVRAALQAAILQPLAELRGEDLRVAMQCLGRLTGRVDADDVLDVVFGSFCIGK